MKFIILAAVVAVACAQCTAPGFDNAATNFVINKDAAYADKPINCANPIDGLYCNVVCTKAGKCGRVINGGVATDIGDILYVNGMNSIQIKTDNSMGQAKLQQLFDADSIELDVECQNGVAPAESGCVSFTLSNDATATPVNSCFSDPTSTLTCPPDNADELEGANPITACTYARQVYSWPNEVMGTDYKVDLQFTVDADIDFWRIQWDSFSASHSVSDYPWNIRCHEQTGATSTGYSWPSNGSVAAGDKVGNIGYMAWSDDAEANDGPQNFSVNGVQCTEVPFVPMPPMPNFTPPDSCSILTLSQSMMGDAEFELPNEGTSDTVLNCDDLIFSDSQCNGFTVDGHNGRYRTAAGDWVYFGNVFYPRGNNIVARNFHGAAFRQALLDAVEIQVFAYCENSSDNTKDAVSDCVSFTVIENDGDEICPYVPVPPEGCTDPEPSTAIDSCTYATQISGDSGNHFTLNFQFTPTSIAGNDVEAWDIEFVVGDGVHVVPTPWNVNCFEQDTTTVIGRNYPSNAFVMNNMMATGMGYNAHSDVPADPADPLPLRDIQSFFLNGVECTETTYMIGADNAGFGSAAASVSAGVGVAAGLVAAALVMVGVAMGRRITKSKKSQNGRSRSASIDSSEVTKGGAGSVAHRGSITSRNARVA